MKQRPYIMPTEATERQRTTFLAWIEQWGTSRALRDIRSEDRRTVRKTETYPTADLSHLVATFDKEPQIAAGQIRLLSPQLLPRERGPAFVAILQVSRCGTFLVAPFSPLQAPATLHELRVRDTPPALSVLSLWNVRPVSVFALRQSWFVDELSPQEIGDALAVYRNVCRLTMLPKRLLDRVGAEAVDPRDPRFEYIDEEGDLWREIVGFPAETETERIVQLPAFQEVAEETAMRLAAESEEDFACVLVIEVLPQRLFAHVFARPREKTLFLVATDPTGEWSHGLDGTLVSLRGTGLVGQIQGGQCLIQVADPTELALRDSSRRDLHITKVEGLTSIGPYSYARLIGMLGEDQDAVSVMTDSELQRLATNRPLDPRINIVVTAEVLFRAWLYGKAGGKELLATLSSCRVPDIDRLLNGSASSLRSPDIWDWEVLDASRLEGTSRDIWNRLDVRVRSFIQADGIIPVVTGESAEAIPIPFNLRANELPGTAIRDIKGIPMPLWDEAEEISSDLLAQHMGVQLQCSTRGSGRHFDGESLELPIVLALARKRGSLPDYPPLSVMASGAIRGDSVAPVSGVDAKMALAQKMGVKVFVTPGTVDSSVVMGVPLGMSVRDVVHRLADRLECAGLDRLDTRTAAARVNSLGDDIHLGTVSLADAAARLNRYEKVLESDTASRIAAEGLVRAKVLKGAIANHSGDPQAGVKATLEAAELATRLRMPLLYVNAVANRIVSLTDLGHLAEAESEGRRLLEWVLHAFSGASAEQMQAEMVACGVLGGQPLLHMAVQGAGDGHEALRLLLRAFEIAKELLLSADICRDAVQIALWHALLDPVRMESEVENASAVLAAHPGAWLTTSQAYLMRIRCLGAYRAARYHGMTVSSLGEWPLPEGRSPTLYWVRATAQKYRGVLFAGQRMIDKAEQDFDAAWTLLDRESPPLLRFIGGTVALAAGEALLGENPPLAMAYLQRAKSVFSLQVERFEGPVKGALWLHRTEGLLSGAPARNLPDPQKCFPY